MRHKQSTTEFYQRMTTSCGFWSQVEMCHRVLPGEIEDMEAAIARGEVG